MTFTENWKNCFKKAFITTGRAPRSEFWMFVLPLVAFIIIYTAVILWITPDYIRPAEYLPARIINILSQLILMPYSMVLYAVTIRRLQDSNHSGWAILWTLLPIIGWIYFFYLMCAKGSNGPNRYGAEPVYQH